MMHYKGYAGLLQVDEEAGLLRGKVVNTKDTITFQGKTVEGAREAFRESVDDYLEFCASLGEPPEKPYSGRFVVRVEPEVHQALSVEAQRKGVSLNRFVSRQLAKAARRTRDALPPAGRAAPAVAPAEQSAGMVKVEDVARAKAPGTPKNPKAPKSPASGGRGAAVPQAGTRRGEASAGKAKPKASK